MPLPIQLLLQLPQLPSLQLLAQLILLFTSQLLVDRTAAFVTSSSVLALRNSGVVLVQLLQKTLLILIASILFNRFDDFVSLGLALFHIPFLRLGRPFLVLGTVLDVICITSIFRIGLDVFWWDVPCVLHLAWC